MVNVCARFDASRRAKTSRDKNKARTVAGRGQECQLGTQDLSYEREEAGEVRTWSKNNTMVPGTRWDGEKLGEKGKMHIPGTATAYEHEHSLKATV